MSVDKDNLEEPLHVYYRRMLSTPLKLGGDVPHQALENNRGYMGIYIYNNNDSRNRNELLINKQLS